MGAATAWLEAELHAQRKFFHGILCILFAMLLRRQGILRPEDSVPLSKVTFQLFMPALLFGKIWKAPLYAELWRLAVASAVVNGLLAIIILLLARFVPKQDGFRGQWVFCMLGNNIAFSYPLVLAVEDLKDTVFPALVIWDICGNAANLLIVNYIVAVVYAPPEQAEEDEGDDMLEAAAAGEIADGVVIGKPAEDQSATPNNNEEVEAKALRRGFTTILGQSIALSASASNARDAPEVVAPESTAPGGPCLFVRALILKLATNIQIAAIFSALAVNFSGYKIPKVVDEFAEILGQPYSVLFFLLVGLNLLWTVIRPRLRKVFMIIFGRLVIAGVVGAAIWFLPIISNRASRHAAIFGLFCPVSGMSMAYAIDHGYDRGLQAALVASSNMVSFSILFALIVGF